MAARSTKHLLKSLLYVCSGASGVFSGMCLYQGTEKFYDNFLIPATHILPPEMAHNVAVKVLKYNLVPKSKYLDPETLKCSVWGINFNNPVGMAAGFDKHGEAIENLCDIGFGFVEVGSITPVPQSGNDKPRVFRLSENKAIINRYGFNSDGHDVVYERLERLRRSNFKGVVGVNLGRNKISSDPIKDYEYGIRKFITVADYFVINISSPNTAGLRDWQRRNELESLLLRLVQVVHESWKELGLPGRHPPLLLKLAPDLTEEQLQDIASVILLPKSSVDGLVVSNTSTERGDDLKGPHCNESGGLSGRPIAKQSTHVIARLYSLTSGKIPIIGVGGIFSGEDAYEKIKAGASLVQVYTSFVFHGSPIITKIKQQLSELLSQDGYQSISEAVGKSHAKEVHAK